MEDFVTGEKSEFLITFEVVKALFEVRTLTVRDLVIVASPNPLTVRPSIMTWLAGYMMVKGSIKAQMFDPGGEPGREVDDNLGINNLWSRWGFEAGCGRVLLIECASPDLFGGYRLSWVWIALAESWDSNFDDLL